MKWKQRKGFDCITGKRTIDPGRSEGSSLLCKHYAGRLLEKVGNRLNSSALTYYRKPFP